ncbi:MoxR family ATPase [Listeria sp. PSOL-1]|uniref:AAA family ATPase n=1 Tax=Listeria sp. PSOL-1 TaxID=1844999 RepID=UPI0013D6FE60|nr:MoxR family ATPase [Listeria sp. PSOL-1]
MSEQPFLQIEKILDTIETVIVGKRHIAKLSLTALLASGHVLIEDVPGVGKTMLVRTLAKSIDATFKRIQFTPDMLPADVIGVSIFNPGTRMFEFRPGPIIGNIILADELNRTTPRTQAALLEGMAEQSITTDGITRQLADPFFVMATQNPIEYEGTYPLPEAQLDRFLLKIKMGYPTRQEELALLKGTEPINRLENLQPAVSLSELVHLKTQSRKVLVSDEVKNYIVALVEATRNHPDIVLGISPRGTLSILHAAQSFALISGRNYVLPDDIQYLLPFVFCHRLILSAEALYQQKTAESLVAEIIQLVPVPIEQREQE